MFNRKMSPGTISNRRFRKSLLAVSIIALSAPLSVQTLAQDDELEEIIVTGIRSSITSAQDLKRNADTVKDVITATDIGALPDKSVTEALQRVPGVTIERFASSDDPKHYADEGTGVLVRGLDRVRSEVNGRDAFSANPWGGLNYEDFPAELLGAVEVVKNQTADLISGGIAGTVNLITRKPFDSNDRVIAFSAKANYGDYREEVTPSISALFSDSWETSAGRFGFLIAGSQSKFETRGDGVGLGNFHSRGDEFYMGSYDQWGTLSAPGLTAGYYDGPCAPPVLGWDPDCEEREGRPTNLITETVPLPVDGFALPGQPAGAVWYVPANYIMTTAENDRERTGFTTSLQWQNADETITATLEHINSKASLEWRERVIASGDRGFVPGSGNAVTWSEEEGYPITVNSNGFLTSGVGKNYDINFPTQFRSRWNYNENTVEDTSLNLTLKPTDRLTVSLDYQRVDSEQIVHNYSMSAQIRGNKAGDVAPFFLDLRGSTPRIEYLSDKVVNPGTYETIIETDWSTWPPTYTYGDNAEVFLGSGMEQEVFATAKSDSFKIDVGYELDGVFTRVKAGGYYSDKDLSIGDTEYSNWVAIGTPWIRTDALAAGTTVAPQLYERVNFSDYYRGKVIQGDNNSFLFPRMDLVKNFADSLRQGCIDGWVGQGDVNGNANDGSGGCAKPYTDLNNRLSGAFAPQDLSSSNEKRTEFYVRGDFELDELAVPIKGNIGARYVNYQLQSTGYLVLPAESRRGTGSLATVMQTKYPDLYALASGDAFQSSVDGTDYSTILPSLNLTFGVTDDVVVRFGASKGLYYPSLVDTRNSMVLTLDYDDVLQDRSQDRDDTTNPVVDLENISISAVSRNPYLEPEESINFDLTTEWYFAPAGSVSVGLFHKKLDNIIRNRSFMMDLEYGNGSYPVSAYGPANTGSGTIRGIEFSYSQFYDFLPGAWSGLGLQFNYTYIDQNGLEEPGNTASADIRFTPDGTQIVDNRNTFRAFTGLPLQGYSDENMNIVGMYEYADISFRLAYTWRSGYLLTIRESEEFVPAYAKSMGHMDASLYYTINDNWKIGLEASNLLNTDTKTSYQLDQQGNRTDALSFTTDRRYALSVRATF